MRYTHNKTITQIQTGFLWYAESVSHSSVPLSKPSVGTFSVSHVLSNTMPHQATAFNVERQQMAYSMMLQNQLPRFRKLARNLKSSKRSHKRKVVKIVVMRLLHKLALKSKPNNLLQIAMVMVVYSQKKTSLSCRSTESKRPKGNVKSMSRKPDGSYLELII